MKKTLRIIIPIILIAGICALTCPNKKDHSGAIKDNFTEHLEKQLGDEGKDSDDGIRKFSSFLGKGMMNMFLESNLTVKNYGVVSIGTIKFKGETNTVSVGVLNHVFTVPFEKIQKQMLGF